MTSVTARMEAAANALGFGSRALDDAAFRKRLSGDPSAIWLVASMAHAAVQPEPVIREAHRQIRLDGPQAWLRRLRVQAAHVRRPAEVVTGRTLVDVHHTIETGFRTGIQRVARAVAEGWGDTATVVGWDDERRGLQFIEDDAVVKSATLRIPWRCTYVLAEVLEPDRYAQITAIAALSDSACAAIGFDCIPITTAETTAAGVAGGFANYLAVLSHFTLIMAISEAAATEFRGWRRMLQGAGITGPDITAVVLPSELAEPDPDAVAKALSAVRTDSSRPMLLCVGTHEPRKNHLAVLHAADLLWRAGRTFELLFIGSRGWWSEEFFAEVARLQETGRPVTVRGADDATLVAAYRAATATVFPSLNEGFGLPLAESLAAGTPVLTSNFGAMAELASAGGTVLVAPDNDAALTAALGDILFNAATQRRLRREIASLPTRTWADYASGVRDAVHGITR